MAELPINRRRVVNLYRLQLALSVCFLVTTLFTLDGYVGRRCVRALRVR